MRLDRADLTAMIRVVLGLIDTWIFLVVFPSIFTSNYQPAVFLIIAAPDLRLRRILGL